MKNALHSRPFASCLASFWKRGPVHNLSYENEFYLHVNENSFSYERLSTKTGFEKEVQDNSEMACLHSFIGTKF